MAARPKFLVYRKTTKAHEELAERRHRLSMRLRQLLLLIDGSRTLEELAVLMRGVEVVPLLAELENEGFIERGVETTSVAARKDGQAKPVGASPKPVFAEKAAAHGARIQLHPPAPSIDPVKLALVKAYLIEVSDQHLGLMASKLQHEIALADGEDTLRSAIARWNMALRESRSGSDAADVCLRTAWNILGWAQ